MTVNEVKQITLVRFLVFLCCCQCQLCFPNRTQKLCLECYGVVTYISMTHTLRSCTRIQKHNLKMECSSHIQYNIMLSTCLAFSQGTQNSMSLSSFSIGISHLHYSSLQKMIHIRILPYTGESLNISNRIYVSIAMMKNVHCTRYFVILF